MDDDDDQNRERGKRKGCMMGWGGMGRVIGRVAWLVAHQSNQSS